MPDVQDKPPEIPAPAELPHKSGDKPDADPGQKQQNASGTDKPPVPQNVFGRSEAATSSQFAQSQGQGSLSGGMSPLPMVYTGLQLQFTGEEIKTQATTRCGVHRKYVEQAIKDKADAEGVLTKFTDGEQMNDAATKEKNGALAKKMAADQVIFTCSRAAMKFDAIAAHVQDGVYRLTVTDLCTLEFDQQN